jgi:hypothetical protein
MRLPFRLSIAGFAVAGTTTAFILAYGDSAAQNASKKTPAAETLRGVDEFASIADTGERSRAFFSEVAKVVTHPRCINCHPATRSPTQGDDRHPHMPPIQAGESGMGISGLYCNSCHHSGNTTIVGSRVGSVPGAEPWLLAPASMAWQGLTIGGICRQLKDPTRNGGRSLADIHKHMSTDHLVAWAWHPGEGRRPAPGSQVTLGALVAAWIATGAECPN